MTDATDETSTDEAIMEATYRVLYKRGYSTITLSRIADELGKSKPLVYHYYENKETLLEALLDHLLDQFETKLARIDREDPRDQIEAIVDLLFPAEMDHDQLRFRRALLEIRSQAPHSYWIRTGDHHESPVAPPETSPVTITTLLRPERKRRTWLSPKPSKPRVALSVGIRSSSGSSSLSPCSSSRRNWRR